MSSGNKILGNVYSSALNIYIYISSKTVTEGLCGSYDGDPSNDLFHRFTGAPATLSSSRVLDDITGSSWRYVVCLRLCIRMVVCIHAWGVSQWWLTVCEVRLLGAATSDGRCESDSQACSVPACLLFARSNFSGTLGIYGVATPKINQQQ